MICPICEKELTVKYYDSINMGTCEYLYVCEGCKLYAEQFAYGGYEITIGHVTIRYSHSTPPDEKERLSRIEKLVVNEYKK